MMTAKQSTVDTQPLIEAKLREIVNGRKGVAPPEDIRFFETNRNENYYNGIAYSVDSDLKLCGFSLSGRVLDLGSGCGTFIKVCRNRGLDPYGIEPDTDVIEVAKLKAVGDGIVKGVGEYLPYRDESFDTITSMSVLEHVQDPEQVIRESVRVLNKNGALWLNAPDYSRCFHEGHYGLFWIPLMPKRLARLYVKAKGRKNAHYVDSIQYVTKRRMMEVLRSLDVEITDMQRVRINHMRERAVSQFVMKVQNPETINSRRWRQIMTLLRRLGIGERTLIVLCEMLYGILILKMRVRLAFDPMVVWVVRKQ
jgi:2-polyprenyl-3-methyl-5-hydroxy-6-metoxy-1,4-benzoquinol methylase